MATLKEAEEKTSCALPFLISWNITQRCNLRCGHCYLDSTELSGPDRIDTTGAFRIVDEIASVNPSAMLILTGGEPLARQDVFEIAGRAADKGLTVVVGTNGALLDSQTIRRLKKSGVKGVGVSLDSATPKYHDAFRGVPGSWALAIQALEELRNKKMPFQIHFSVSKDNATELPGVIELGEKAGAMAINVFFLVCTGRGQDKTDLSADEYEKMLEYLYTEEINPNRRIMVRARCAPHFLRVARRLNPESSLLRGHTSGCIAGSGYMRITPDGFVTPCPYMPADDRSPNILKTALSDIWRNTGVFKELRLREYKGKCGDCEHADLCGGCRARSLASGNGLMGEDSWCMHEPEGFKIKNPDKKGAAPVWTAPALERLERVPAFLRNMVKGRVEEYAKAIGVSDITPDMMAELKKRFDNVRG